ncbi:MAG: class I adenylate-forming enzyme family protein [Sphingomonas sp.]|uniref:class I adenylate-forming enzyme family protein n=1 Tax=Sphingomonas sp. TaxID=28214 RepID=UPI0022746AF4|nr:class I adenylate-forming enzyme family protein [Sphingomonas sp.]MCX8474651.1 class I adenylate-forming enzyme family protein [Sphingomonas sp.]
MASHHADGVTWTDARLWPQFAALAEADPDATALIDCDDRRWTRGELRALASACAVRLEAAGVAPGTRVLVAGAKHAGTIVVALAVSACEAVFCPYSPKLAEAELRVLEDRLGHVARVVADAQGGAAIIGAGQGSRSGDPRDREAVLIGFTSGSTGVPKGVIHGAEALNHATRTCAAIAGLEDADSILAIVPLDSAPGFTFTAHFALSQGRALVLVDPWDPVAAMARAVDHRCGWAIMVPTHLFTILEAARTSAWSGRLPLRAAAVGGSAMTAELIADAETLLGLKALRMFGMSECMGHCSTRPSDPLSIRQATDGIPFPGTEEEAFGPDGVALPRGRRGQAGVRGPSLFLGYAEGLGAGQERMTADGFYLTGDEIVRDEAGFVTVVGRIKDQIIRGGFNIDPAEIEAALLRHPAIAEVAVVGVPDRKLGEQACAVCRVRRGAAPIAFDMMIAHLVAQGLSRKKWPEHLLFVDAMAVGATGKLDKRAMAARAAAALGRG